MFGIRYQERTQNHPAVFQHRLIGEDVEGHGTKLKESGSRQELAGGDKS